LVLLSEISVCRFSRGELVLRAGIMFVEGMLFEGERQMRDGIAGEEEEDGEYGGDDDKG
jgi:hypothetical protein